MGGERTKSNEFGSQGRNLHLSLLSRVSVNPESIEFVCAIQKRQIIKSLQNYYTILIDAR